MDTSIEIKPPKKFFFHTLTLDISPEEAILELIDTFIEWYLYYKNKSVVKYKGEIIIQMSEEKLIIESNYPGPPKDSLPDILVFGKRLNIGCNKIGAYGIGTKRAFFKLGKDILLESDDNNNYFSIHIGKKWFDVEDDWNLTLKSNKSKGRLCDKIVISSLYNDIKVQFKDPTFKNGLLEKIKYTYSYFINNHINIKINNIKIKPCNFEFIFKKGKIEPYYKEFIRNGIKVKILAGITREDYKTFGWYVFCNNRLIIKRDTSNKTGFNTSNEVLYIPNPNIFLGLVFFSSFLFSFKKENKKYLKEGIIFKELQKLFLENNIEVSKNSEVISIKKYSLWKIEDKENCIDYMIDASGNKLIVCTDPINLPEKSSKDDIREDSAIYRVAQDYMRNITERYMNYIETIKEKKEYLRELLEYIETKKIEKFLKDNNGINEKLGFFELLKEETREEILKGKRKITSIQFWEPIEIVEDIKKNLGNVNMSNEEMGKKILQYYREMEGRINERT